MKDPLRRRLAVERSSTDALDLNLRSLDVFVKIAESGGMSSTARRMGLTQSAVSQMIANLENSLGVQLFDRQVRPIALTPSGIILLEKARGVLLAARDAIQAAREPSTAAFPKLNLGLIDTIAGTIGPDLISHIHEFAGVWSVRTGVFGQHTHSLLCREADIILTSDGLENEPNLERYEILKERFFMALPRELDSRHDDLADLAAKHDLIRFSGRTMSGRQTERHLRRLRIEARGRLEFDNADAILAMVAGGLGWAVITPLSALVGRVFWPQLRFEPLPEPAFFRRICVVARQGELGDIPKLIAHRAARSLEKIFVSELYPYHPWIEEGCIIQRPKLPARGGELKVDVQPSAS